MPTIFYQARFAPEVPLTCLFREYLTVAMQKASEGDLGEALLSAVSSGLKECGLRESPTDEEVVSVITRLNAEAKELEDTADAGSTGAAGKHFSGYLTEWASKMGATELCLYAAGYNYQEAERLYCELDRQVLVAIAHDKLQLEFERARISFEAALFGFGGGYRATPKGDEEVFDLTSSNPFAEVSLKNLGF